MRRQSVPQQRHQHQELPPVPAQPAGQNGAAGVGPAYSDANTGMVTEENPGNALERELGGR